MVMLAVSGSNIFKNCYYLYNPTDSWNLFDPADCPASKREAVERLMLGILKATAAFFIYSSLYVTKTRLESGVLKGVALACAFCIFPLATIDFQFICGMYEVYTAFAMLRESRQELKEITDKAIEQAKEQVKSEGYRFYNFWESNLYGTDGPPETMNRWHELFLIVVKTPELKQWTERTNPLVEPAWELLKQGGKRLGISVIEKIAINNLTDSRSRLFWLDRKMVDFSKWLATHLV